ncbi:MAG: TraX family protein [Clostridia bacterium]|nr:TraX family protein [Clostridia bacterium]
MSCLVLKIIALVTMVIDHVGAIFFPDVPEWRIIGRIAFPIYAFLLAQGFIHTGSRKKYATRLLLFGLISEIPHDLAIKGVVLEQNSQNIMFELLMGLLVIWCIDIYTSKNATLWQRALALVPVIPLTLATAYFSMSYGVYGVVLMVGYYIFSKWQIPKLGAIPASLAGSGITWVFNGIKVLRLNILGKAVKILSKNGIQTYAIYAGLPIMLYNGKPGKYKLRWFFYLSYPGHLFILWVIARIIGVR